MELDAVAVLNRFRDYFKNRFRAGLPSNYLCWDLEATGFSRDDDLIVEIGHCVVHDRKPVQRMATLLDWTRSEHVNQDWLRDKLNYVKKCVETDEDGNPNGRRFDITYERLRKEGVPPEDAFEYYFDLFARVHNGGGFFVGQNVYAFDAEMFAAQTAEFLGEAFKFEPDVMIDVGALEKATQLGMGVFDDETLKDYFKRVASFNRKGVKWNIEHCVNKYKLPELYGIKAEELHGAGEDSYVCHLVYEEIRNIIEA